MRRVVFILILVLPLTCIQFAGAVTTSFFRTETFDDFSLGTPENISVKKDGTVSLSPPLTEKFESLEPYIWSVTLDKKGNIYAGTGNEGRVYKIEPDGDSLLLFDSPEAEILSLLIDRSGKLFAGTAPNGIIYLIDDSGGEVYFDSEESYIWSMALDKDGNIIAGTGDKGKIYRVKKNRKAEVIFESGQPNITRVAVRDEKIYAGSADSGILFMLEGKKTRVLYDTPDKEIRSILFDESGDILIGTTNGEYVPGGDLSENESGASPVTPGASAIYKVSETGIATQIVSWPSYTLLSMARLPDGNLVVGTGEEGKLLKVREDGTTEIMNKVEALQVIAIAANGKFVLSTGNMGKVYTLGKTYAKEGDYTSQVFDALTMSSWGVISWNARTPKGTSVKLQTRTGNTEKPGQTWSDWSDSYTKSKGTKVASPQARFLQWRAILSARDLSVTPTLRDVSVAYLQKNLNPKIVGVAIDQSAGSDQPPGGFSEGSGSASSSAGRDGLKGHLTVSWQVEDANGDSLKHTVRFKGDGQKNWLTMDNDLRMNSYTFDSQSLPDGKYKIEVEASDSPSNPDNLALSDARESDPFTIDNTAPEVFRMGSDVMPARKYRVTFQVEDETSPVASCEYSIDASPWRPVFPIDEIFDTKEESFVHETPSLSPGQHIIVVRATDTAHNVGTNRLIIDVK